MNLTYICVTPFFPTPSTWQGAYVLDQVKAIKKHSDYNVVVFRTLPLGEKEYTYEIDGIVVHAIAPLLMPSYFLNGLTGNIVGDKFVQTIRKLGIDPMNVKYVHCHTVSHSAFGFGLKKINPNIIVMIQFHDLDPLTLRNGKWASKWWNRRYRARKSINALNHADLLICISEAVKEVLDAFPHPREKEVYDKALQIYPAIEKFSPLKPNDIYILNNGVDTTLFNRCYQKISNGIFRIGCVANFQELKDHNTLVRAFKILVDKGYTNMRLSLLGSGETRSAIECYLRQNNIYEMVEWPPEVSHSQLPKYYHSLSLFVLPSIYEGFGCVCTESYACGVPFICCENQGAAECVMPNERTKWLFEPRNAANLASKIERYYWTRDEQHLCKPYDIDTLIADFLKYINSK